MRKKVIHLAERNTQQPVVVHVQIRCKRYAEQDEEQVGDCQVKYVKVGYVIEFSVGDCYKNYQTIAFWRDLNQN